MKTLYPLQLEPGKFYRARDGEIWCCFRRRPKRGGAERHAEVDCIRVSDCRVEYFYLDGRYDSAGKREHTLVEETSYGDVQDL